MRSQIPLRKPGRIHRPQRSWLVYPNTVSTPPLSPSSVTRYRNCCSPIATMHPEHSPIESSRDPFNAPQRCEKKVPRMVGRGAPSKVDQVTLNENRLPTSVVNYKKPYFQLSTRHIGGEEEKEKPALIARVRHESRACQLDSGSDVRWKGTLGCLGGMQGIFCWKKPETKMYIA